MSSSKSAFNITPVASTVPFNNSANGFTSTDTQAAIEEAKALAANSSRGGLICGHDGASSVGRYLAFYPSNPSNTNPLIIPEPSELVALSISASANSTGTLTVYRNFVPVTTISLSSSRKNRIQGLEINLTDLDELSVSVTSGSISKPMMTLFIRTI